MKKAGGAGGACRSGRDYADLMMRLDPTDPTYLTDPTNRVYQTKCHK
jgi:hypothetical protein